VPMAIGDRADDFPSLADHPSREAKALTRSPDGKLAAHGAIERVTDVDAFSFNWRGGVAQIECQTSEYSTLDPVLTILNADESPVGYAQTKKRGEKRASVTANLPAGTYYVVVTAGDEIGEVGYYALTVGIGSGEIPTPMQPSPSLVLNGEATATGIALTWNEMPQSQSYRIEKSTDGVSYDAVITTGRTSALDANVDPGTTYFYRAQADTPSEPACSAPLRVRSRPAAVTHIHTFGLEPGLIILEWRDVLGENGYRIERSIDGNKFATIAAVEQNTCGFRDADVAPGHQYFYRVAAVDGPGESPLSEPISGISGIGQLSATPNANDGIVVTWQAGYPHDRVAVERATGCRPFTPVALVNSHINTFVDKTAASGGKLQYRVVAVEDGKELDRVRSGEIDTIKLPSGVDEDYFALRFTGKIGIKNPDRYTFYLDSDDGSRLFIDGAVIIDNDGRHAHQKLSGVVDLNAGQHDLEIHYFEYFGSNALSLSWSHADRRESKVPASVFSSLTYQYYKGDWSYLPFNEAIAMSDVVTVRTPKATDDPKEHRKP
jgi:hypothetical protein